MATAPSPAIELSGLRRDFGERPVLDDVTFTLATGQSMVVLGPNGAGKTTLLRILATLLRPSGGEATVLGNAIPSDGWKLRGRVGYLGHDALLYRDLTARENLRFHARLHGIESGEAEQRIDRLLGQMGMSRRADERIDALSAGMRQRIAVCRCVLHQPDLLLLDEPDSNLDAESRGLTRELLGSSPGRTRVTVTHDPDRSLPDADRVLELDRRGRVLREGPA